LPPEPFFSGGGLDRADQLRSQPERISELVSDPAARQLQWLDGFPALDSDGRLLWGKVDDPALFLGLDNGAPRFTSLVPQSPADARAAFAFLPLLDSADAPIFAAAQSLTNWHRRHPFCANCGQPSAVVRGGWSRRCDNCGAEHFPRVDPVVIMLAEHDGRLLLGRQPQYPPGRFSALAGFVEAGETIEAAVARELAEEAGIAVADVTYVASQPWPFPSSLMVGCTARAFDDRLTIDKTELDDARWFTREEVAAALVGAPAAAFLPPPPYAIARTLLENWLALEVAKAPA
jgi:NAD+ diphosphatase